MNQRDPKTDELLNSFMDGELTPKQQTEVERLITEDKHVARRLRELQQCKVLVQSVPRAKAPAGTFERIRASLQERVPVGRQTLASDERIGTRPFVGRRVVAVAAMVALMAVLAVIIYSIGTPEPVPDRVTPVRPALAAGAAAGFGGRLELKTNALANVAQFINRAIQDNGLSDCVNATSVPGREVYALSCSRADLNVLLADLAIIWDKFGSATLSVQTKQFGKAIPVDAVTAEQIAEIADQDSHERCVAVAKDFAVLNNMTEFLPGHDILAAIHEKKPSLITVPKPVLTGGPNAPRQPVQPKGDGPQVHLTIVVEAGK